MVALLLMVGNTAWADKFQIKDKRSGGEVFTVPFATVKLRDGALLGRTDRYGRLTVTNLDDGEYQAEVVRGTQTRTATLTVDGGQDMKVVYLD